MGDPLFEYEHEAGARSSDQRAARLMVPRYVISEAVPGFQVLGPLTNGYRGDMGSFRGSIMLLESPAKIASADEVHVLASMHEAAPDGREICSMGLSPSGALTILRLIGEGDGELRSATTAINALRPDGLWHSFACDYQVVGDHERFVIDIDGGIFVRGRSPVTAGFYPRRSTEARLMLHNGLAGTTRCRCALGAVMWGDQVFDPGYPLRGSVRNRPDYRPRTPVRPDFKPSTP